LQGSTGSLDPFALRPFGFISAVLLGALQATAQRVADNLADTPS
jgi:hypothetical protein